MPIRIVIVDDHGIIRTGLRTLLADEPDMVFVGDASTAESALELIRETQPDVVTLDIGLPDRSGLEIIPAIHEISPGTRVLIFTGKDDPAVVRQAMLAGSAGYVVKAASFYEVGTAIRNLHQGRSLILITQTADSGESLLGFRLDDKDSGNSALTELSDREQEVLKLIAEGHTNQAIAERLYLSVKTIETYRSRLARKLNLKTRAEMVSFAFDAGLVHSAKCHSPKGTSEAADVRVGEVLT